MNPEGEPVKGLRLAGIVPHRDAGEIPCARDLCRDGYTVHAADGQPGGCAICPCAGFLWVPPHRDDAHRIRA